MTMTLHSSTYDGERICPRTHTKRHEGQIASLFASCSFVWFRGRCFSPQQICALNKTPTARNAGAVGVVCFDCGASLVAYAGLRLLRDGLRVVGRLEIVLRGAHRVVEVYAGVNRLLVL